MEKEVTDFDLDNDEVNYPRQLKKLNKHETGGNQKFVGYGQADPAITVEELIRRLGAYSPKAKVLGYIVTIEDLRPETDAEWKARVSLLKTNRAKKLREFQASFGKDVVLAEMIKQVLAGKSVEELIPTTKKATKKR